MPRQQVEYRTRKPRFTECLQFQRRGSFLHFRHIPTILICRIDTMPCKQQYLIVQKGLRTIQVSWQYEMAEEEKLLEYRPVVTTDQQHPLIVSIEPCTHGMDENIRNAL